ncbi:hypothetical protein D3C75_446280 [compost metagenome]
MIERGPQCGGQALIQLRVTRLLTRPQPLSPAVAEGALLHLPLTAEGLEVDGQAVVAVRCLGATPFFMLAGPGQVVLAGAVTGLAADGLLVPGGGEAVALVVVTLVEGGGVAIRAHGVPVLVTPGPVQGIAGGKALARIEGEPTLSALRLGAAVPGQGQGLQAAAGEGDQVLLQRIMAEGVEDLDVNRLALFPLETDEIVLSLAKEAGLDASFVEMGVVEIPQHVVRGGVAHGPGMVGPLPLGHLAVVTT